VDPRSGEILDADIGMSDVFARGARRQVIEDFSRPAGHAHEHAPANALSSHKKLSTCNYMNESAHELHFAFDLLEARGLDMDSPEAEAVAQSYVKDVIMHEVGHTLGFRHNFKASTVYSAKQIQDVEFTKKNGITTSVMDYTPFNIAAKGEKQPEYGMSTLGAYDYWVVDYAYRQIDAAKETEELAKIAARSTEPQLIYATDEDAGYATMFYGIDPEANRFDLGADPLEYYKKRLKLSRELWDRLEALQLKPGESYERLTRSFVAGLNQVARVAPLAAKYVGGVKHLRDRAGSGRALYEPTSPARQREALKLVADGLLKVDSFKFRPEFVSRIGIDHFERRANPDVSISAAVLGTQRQALDVLLADNVAQRLLDSADKVADPSKAFKLAELYDTVQNAIWSELKAGGDINPLRRNLQREHLRRVVNALVKPAPTTPADARALQRMNAQQLAAQIKAAMGKAGNKETKAHLAESLDLLSEALKASIQRTV
ncbi:MAG TPA: zinc-dependent metalloprotease, partial [Usitatibacteraceae bacterium]|nr:zinc-dependent metalloprotease [Usitatibacteraceae bacterium]